jgi:phosphoglycerol transferase MdoB-like AlkP superfamily enzyme
MSFKNYYMLVFLKRFLLVFGLLTIIRLLFWVFNYNYLPDADAWAFVYGLRFDASNWGYLFFLFTLVHLAPMPKQGGAFQERLLKILFIVSVSLVVVLNSIDFIYFQFNFRRTTADVTHFFGNGGDAWRLLPRFVLDYWYLGIIWVILIWASIWVYNQTYMVSKMATSTWYSQLLYFNLAITFSVLACRGGLQPKPISILDAGLSVKSTNIPLALNTPFSIYATWLEKTAKLPSFMDLEEAKQLFPLQFTPLQQTAITPPRNVVILILESFGKEYIGFYNEGKGYTPFLDSLLAQSTTYTNSYANGRRSVDAVPAILAGIPYMMDGTYVYSPYGANRVNSLAKILHPKGYYTSFMHGGAKGTMGFEAFCNLAEFDEYVGMDSYPNQTAHYDGNWGVFDEHFLQFAIEKMDKQPKPFLTSIFTLSSHHPYTIPKEYKNKFKKGSLPIHESIGYADYALKEFFKTIEKKSWFKETLFVITADHTAQNADKKYSHPVAGYMIPIAFYQQGMLPKKDSVTSIHQSDLIQEIPQKLGVSLTGKSIGNLGNNQVSIFYEHGCYHYLKNGYYLASNGQKPLFLSKVKQNGANWKYVKSSNLAQKKTMQQELQAYLEQYFRAMDSNQLYD